MMGKIVCANVLSDLYVKGVTDCDNMLMLLAVSTKITEKERDVVIPLIMRGFKDSTLELGLLVLLERVTKLLVLLTNPVLLKCPPRIKSFQQAWGAAF